MLVHLLSAISSVRLYIPRDLRPLDNRQSVLKSIQVGAPAAGPGSAHGGGATRRLAPRKAAPAASRPCFPAEGAAAALTPPPVVPRGPPKQLAADAGPHAQDEGQARLWYLRSPPQTLGHLCLVNKWVK